MSAFLLGAAFTGAILAFLFVYALARLGAPRETETVPGGEFPR